MLAATADWDRLISRPGLDLIGWQESKSADTWRHKHTGRTVVLLNTHVNYQIETGQGFEDNLKARRAKAHLRKLAGSSPAPLQGGPSSPSTGRCPAVAPTTCHWWPGSGFTRP